MANPSLIGSQANTAISLDWFPNWSPIAACPVGIYHIADTQNLADNNPAGVLDAIGAWVATRPDILPDTIIVAATGDNVNTGESQAEWLVVNAAFDHMDAAASPIPYMVVRGNHDIGASNYFNTYFPQSRYTGQAWWSGDFETAGTSKDKYLLFSAGGYDFILITISGDSAAHAVPEADHIAWMESTLTTYSTRLAIIAVHPLLSSVPAETLLTDNPDCTALWTAIAAHNNVILVLSGHAGLTHRVTAGGDGHSILQSQITSNNGVIEVLGIDPVAEMIYRGQISMASGEPHPYYSAYPDEWMAVNYG